MADVSARWLTFDLERGRQAEPVWRSNSSGEMTPETADGQNLRR
jgi:hypothetical protein